MAKNTVDIAKVPHKPVPKSDMAKTGHPPVPKQDVAKKPAGMGSKSPKCC